MQPQGNNGEGVDGLFGARIEAEVGDFVARHRGYYFSYNTRQILRHVGLFE